MKRKGMLEEPLTKTCRRNTTFAKSYAVQNIHFPIDREAMGRFAKNRLIFEELLFIRCATATAG